MIPGKLDAILAIKSDAEVSTLANGSLNWIDGNPTNITDEQIATKLAELQAEYDTQEYARKREAEFPSIQDLVVALYDTEDKAAIDSKRAEIKLKYPKPGA
jgi:hypothetical protein|tara:strand:- start:148 stop:450 length:303 start_codon:yes stop_codon:yes gene_type:complete